MLSDFACWLLSIPFSCYYLFKLKGYLKLEEGEIDDAALLSFDKLFSIVSLIFLARVDFPMPGRPTGTKNSFVTDRISSVETRSTRNFKRAS